MTHPEQRKREREGVVVILLIYKCHILCAKYRRLSFIYCPMQESKRGHVWRVKCDTRKTRALQQMNNRRGVSSSPLPLARRCSIAADSVFAGRTALLAMTSAKTQVCRASCVGFSLDARRRRAKKALRNKQRYNDTCVYLQRGRAKEKKEIERKRGVKEEGKSREKPAEGSRHVPIRLFTSTPSPQGPAG